MTLPLDLTGYDVPDRPRLVDDSPLVVVVIGKPITQGSKTRGRWGMFDDNKDTLHPWRDSVTAAAIDARRDRPTIQGPVEVSAWFYFDRPQSHYGTGRNAGRLKDSAPPYPLTQAQGDVDKLVRACLDSLKVAKVFRDDKLVARVYAEKLWTGGAGMDLQGARIHISELTR
jgi:crossover junction endodeoxyribonuclease RusA